MKTKLPNWNGEYLAEARKARGLTVAALSEITGGAVKREALSSYEHNRNSPPLDSLSCIAKALNVPEEFFLRPPRQKTINVFFWRCLAASSKVARERNQLKTYWIEDIVEATENVVQLPNFDIPNPGITNPLKLDDWDIETIADDLRQEWRLGVGPISNLVWAVEGHGIITARLPLEAAKLDAFTAHSEKLGRSIIVLNSEKGIACRSRFDLAHELGHEILHRRLIKDKVDMATHRLLEHQANRFAAALLMPSESIAQDFKIANLDAFAFSKKRWGASIKAVVHRFHSLGAIADETYRKLMINYSRRKWNQGEPFDDTWQIEFPYILGKSIQMIAGLSQEAKLQLKSQVCLNDVDIETLSGLEESVLTDKQVDLPEARILEIHTEES